MRLLRTEMGTICSFPFQSLRALEPHGLRGPERGIVVRRARAYERSLVDSFVCGPSPGGADEAWVGFARVPIGCFVGDP